MSYFQVPPGFSTSACLAPMYAIGVLLVGYAAIKFVIRELIRLFTGGRR